jgi:Polyketide cyclase / dehydrase and lipid transport
VPECSRVSLHKSAQLSAPPADVWALICDWAGMLRWWLPAAQGGPPGPALIGCDLIGAPDGVPRTRRMTLENGLTADEQVFYQDDDTRRMYYTKSPDQRITGYVASTYVDPAPGGCTVHIASTFDVLDPARRDGAAAFYEGIYTAMFEGYERYFRRLAAG